MATASTKRIMVVDDEPDIRDFLATSLEDAGFEVETAIDGVDALNRIQNNIPDLITLDMVMPRKSGLSLMRRLRKNDRWKEIPVIIITAHAQDEFASEDVKEMLLAFEAKQRPRHIMEKPIVPAELIRRISEILSVEVDMSFSDERNDIIKLLNSADPVKLKEIHNLLK